MRERGGAIYSRVLMRLYAARCIYTAAYGCNAQSASAKGCTERIPREISQHIIPSLSPLHSTPLHSTIAITQWW